MDIYRFFHPHHNPRLLGTPLRLQELCELEQAASELRKALHRAQQRVGRAATPPLLPQHFDDLMKAMRFVEASLHTLAEAHPGDTIDDMRALAIEREQLRGWESWTSLIQEQLAARDAESARNGDTFSAQRGVVDDDLEYEPPQALRAVG